VRSVLFFFPTGQFDLFGDRQLSSVRRIQEQHLKEEMMMGPPVWTSAVLTVLLLLLVPRIDASGSNSALKAKVHTQFIFKYSGEDEKYVTHTTPALRMHFTS
jgi:hypothetical protein